MFIAHLPAGYIASSLLRPRFAANGVRQVASLDAFLGAGLLGAVAPDVDLVYFYLVDHQQHPHHAYVSHFPLLWVGLFSIALAWLAWRPMREAAALATIFSLNALLHMILDTVVGEIRWLAPFSDTSYALFSVPARYHPWWLNFILHWSFAMECSIVLAAFWLWRRRFILAR